MQQQHSTPHGDAFARLDHSPNQQPASHQTIRLPDPKRRGRERLYLPEDHAFEQEAKDWIWHKGHQQGHVLGSFLHDEATDRIYNFCHCCGKRVTIDAFEHHYTGEVLTERCERDLLRVLETKAWLSGEMGYLLEGLLEEEVARLGPTMAARFLQGEIQIDKQRVISMDGFFAISWRLREWPHQPISESNPQSLIGFFDFTKVVDEDSLRRGRYIGPRINPNGHEDRDQWAVYPLETGEDGFIYQDDSGCWRFKRKDGVVGFYPQPDTLLYQDGSPVPHTRKREKSENDSLEDDDEEAPYACGSLLGESLLGPSPLELFTEDKTNSLPLEERDLDNPCFYP